MSNDDVCALLGVTLPQLLALMQNAAFPQPLANDGAGDIVWDPDAIAAFAALMAAATANNWPTVPDDMLALAPWDTMAAQPPGQNLSFIADSDPLTGD